ncbi:unnamed protein product [Rotaria sp. Silwood2]|nr:unnamed protein product [Rotaria sp. Silwood2]CAF2685621.1 unnamed protein product [Rotaria sp. Silwood2]CAF3093829.1 unnamed protein product [Rotaria sp. Silwood2]CAF4021010.1 unnamed protein product [Rotaria sp. Silwood2]CAF4030167.1 unnamed protein product [Rotaria sp. Silwood2]
MSNSVNVINRSSKPTRIGFFKNRGPYQPSFDAEKVIELKPHTSQLVKLEQGWEGRIQKLSGAAKDPATWAEIHFNAWKNMTFADISLIRGYNGSMLFTSNDDTLRTGMTDDLWAEAPEKFKAKDSKGNNVLAPTEPYTGGRNEELVAYYRRRVTNGNAYLIPDDHASSHGTQDIHINLELYDIPNESTGIGNRNISTRVIALRSNANGKFVCAENAGKNSLIANRVAVSSWETFNLIFLNGKNVALKSCANGKYVCAENAGDGPLIANRSQISLWETFRLIDRGNGKVALVAVNGKYVCADNYGNSELIANRTSVESWETFDLVQQ